MEGILKRRQELVCRHFARKGDLASLRRLSETGLLDDETARAELDAATREGNAQATGCLLELTHARGSATGIDFSL